jgi:tetratricopeptide (TPR) repeat protein
MLARRFVVAAALTLVAGCATAPKSPYTFDKAALAGMVYDLDSRPVAGLVLTLVDMEPALVAQTDVLGRFLIPEVPRGKHRVRAVAAGFETADSEISFLARTQIMYIRIASLEQLVNRAVGAAETGEWQRAEGYLGRAEALAPAELRVRYVRAVLETRAGRHDGARRLLEALLADGFRRPAIYLLLADIHERALGEPERAAEYLREYLKLRRDPAAEERLARLSPEAVTPAEAP